MKLVVVGTDREIFKEGSRAQKRILEQSKLFDEMHVIIFANKKLSLNNEKIGNLWLYPTNGFSKWFNPWRAIFCIRKIFKNRKLSAHDTVISTQDPFESGWVGLITSLSFLVPLHVQVHTDLYSAFFTKKSLLNKIRVILARFVLKHSKAVRVVSERISVSLSKKYPDLVSRINILPVYFEPISGISKRTSDVPVVAMVCRLSREKDLALAIRSVAHINIHQALRLVIVGDGVEKSALKKLAQQLGCEDNVTFAGWREDLADVYSNADIGLSTSQFEGFGLSMLEFAYHGIPLVATDSGIAGDLIKAPFSRFLCKVGDQNCIESAILELINNKELRNQYQKAISLEAMKFYLPASEYWRKYKEDIARAKISSL
jgi:glycosyltransferase involved in cell wall biosynthesis